MNKKMCLLVLLKKWRDFLANLILNISDSKDMTILIKPTRLSRFLYKNWFSTEYFPDPMDLNSSSSVF